MDFSTLTDTMSGILGNDNGNNSQTKKEEKSPLFVSGLNNGPTVLNSSVQVRLNYLRKVYSILAAQLALTVVIASAIMFSSSVLYFVARNPWIMIVTFLAEMGTMFGLMYKRTEYPTNFYLLGAFTLLNSFTIGIVISTYAIWTVLQAFVITTAVVVGLTLYTLTSKKDFSYLGGILSSLGMVMFVGSLLHVWFGNGMTDTILAVFGAGLFSTYLIYDTHITMKYLSAEEYIIAVMNLYMDIINLFIQILKIVDALKRANSDSDESNRRRKRRN